VERRGVIRLYYAASIDGFIADRDGGVAWLDTFNDYDYGYEDFVKQLDSIVFGRRTYEQQLGFGAWPFKSKRCFVLTSRAFSDPNVEAARDVDRIVLRLSEGGQENTWIIGGGQTMGAFLERGVVDRIEHHVIPVLLGAGIPVFAGLRSLSNWRLAETKTFPNGVVHLAYEAKR
jgi:dihydrofolate reductase